MTTPLSFIFYISNYFFLFILVLDFFPCLFVASKFSHSFYFFFSFLFLVYLGLHLLVNCALIPQLINLRRNARTGSVSYSLNHQYYACSFVKGQSCWRKSKENCTLPKVVNAVLRALTSANLLNLSGTSKVGGN